MFESVKAIFSGESKISERAALMLRIEKMNSVTSERLNTVVHLSGVSNGAEVAKDIVAVLNKVKDPDYQTIGIVQFGLVPRIVVDCSDRVHVDLRLSSNKCSFTKEIVSKVELELKNFLKSPGAPVCKRAPQVAVLNPGDEGFQPWSLEKIEPLTRAVVKGEQQYLVAMVSAGFIRRGAIPDSIYSQGVKLFSAFKDDANQLEKATNFVRQKLQQSPALRRFIPDLDSANFSRVVEQNKAEMVELASRGL